MGVKIWTEDDYSIRTPEIDSDATSPCREEVDEYIRFRTVELVHALLAIGLLRIPVVR